MYSKYAMLLIEAGVRASKTSKAEIKLKINKKGYGCGH